MVGWDLKILENIIWLYWSNNAGYCVFKESLLYKVLRGKYFLNLDFLEAALGNNPSWRWSNFLEARKLLKEDIIWNVGQRSIVKIWEEPWVEEKLITKPNVDFLLVKDLMTLNGD